MYFLKDGEIVEGSERIEIVVRDAITGMRLPPLPQTRDVTTNISYREGRLSYRAGTQRGSAGWASCRTRVARSRGNPVFVEVEYDYNAPALDNGDKAYAFQARQSVGDRVTVGAGVVTEDAPRPAGSKYDLFGVDVQGPSPTKTRVTAELAHSEGSGPDTW